MTDENIAVFFPVWWYGKNSSVYSERRLRLVKICGRSGGHLETASGIRK